VGGIWREVGEVFGILSVLIESAQLRHRPPLTVEASARRGKVKGKAKGWGKGKARARARADVTAADVLGVLNGRQLGGRDHRTLSLEGAGKHDRPNAPKHLEPRSGFISRGRIWGCCGHRG
jgi:hypothetical protein